MKGIEYAKQWLRDALGIFNLELRNILHDGGVMIIFVVAGLLYPILYNFVYRNGILEDTPIAVVDDAACSDTRRMIREMDGRSMASSTSPPTSATAWPRRRPRPSASTPT